MKLHQTLSRKGWTPEEIQEAQNIIDSRHQLDKSGTQPFMNRVVYLVALIVSIIGNLLISVVLIPFLLVLGSIQLYIIIGTLALAFGLLFNLLINDIDHMETHHHIIAGVFIPGFALINVFVMVKISNIAQEILQITNNAHNPYIISIIYVIGFTLPLIVTKITDKFYK